MIEYRLASPEDAYTISKVICDTLWSTSIYHYSRVDIFLMSSFQERTRTD